MPKNQVHNVRIIKKKAKKVSSIKEKTLRDLDFYIYHGCGD